MGSIQDFICGSCNREENDDIENKFFPKESYFIKDIQ